MRYCRIHRQAKQALAFLHALPKRCHALRTYNMALQACAACGDMETATATLVLASKQRLQLDTKLLTSYINGMAVAGSDHATATLGHHACAQAHILMLLG